MRKDLDDLIVKPDTTVVAALGFMDKGAKGIIFVCEDNILRSVVTDGDIRRHILKGKSLEDSVSLAANPNFTPLPASASREEAVGIMAKKHIDCIPVLADTGMLLGAFFINDVMGKKYSSLNLPVVIMAGGKGTRLYPYTKILPKPLIPIGNKTITELIMDQFLPYNCNDFTMIVNHKKNMIKAFFSDEDLDYNVNFVDENIPLGTGGGLGLLKSKINNTFFMTNCDVLLFEDYSKIIDYHNKNNNLVTMICATQTVTIPYGTIEVDSSGQIVSMTEKPSFSFLTNTGFYVLEPEFLDYIPDNIFIHITDVIQACVDNNEKVGMYPVSVSQWSDMGQLEELEKTKERLGH